MTVQELTDIVNEEKDKIMQMGRISPELFNNVQKFYDGINSFKRY